NVLGSDDLRKEEQQKIKHAERLFKNIGREVSIIFQTQFEQDLIIELIKKTSTHPFEPAKPTNETTKD
ncbi:MAG: hypothetical protein Q4C68_08720, partial [Moraxella sp.]|nr:hypothetical protein [Moraxella sp.]